MTLQGGYPNSCRTSLSMTLSHYGYSICSLQVQQRYAFEYPSLRNNRRQATTLSFPAWGLPRGSLLATVGNRKLNYDLAGLFLSTSATSIPIYQLFPVTSAWHSKVHTAFFFVPCLQDFVLLLVSVICKRRMRSASKLCNSGESLLHRGTSCMTSHKRFQE